MPRPGLDPRMIRTPSGKPTDQLHPFSVELAPFFRGTAD
jgi:hypothetical protein